MKRHRPRDMLLGVSLALPRSRGVALEAALPPSKLPPYRGQRGEPYWRTRASRRVGGNRVRYLTSGLEHVLGAGYEFLEGRRAL